MSEAAAFLLILARVSGCFLGLRQLISLLGTAAAGVVCFAVAVLFFSILPQNAAPSYGTPLLGWLLFSEFVFGWLLAVPFALLLELLPAAARLIESGRSALVAEQFSPELGHRTSALETFAVVGSAALLVHAGGLEVLIRILLRSFRYPAGTVAAWLPGLQAETAIRYSSSVLTSAFCFSAPVLILLLVLDLCFGIIARCLPKLNVFVELLPLRLLVGFACAALLLPLVAQTLTNAAAAALEAAGWSSQIR